MDGAAPEPIGTRDAVIDVAYSVGALATAVQRLAAGLGGLSEAVRGGDGDRLSALAAAETALADAKLAADAGLTNVVKLLEAMGQTRP